MDVVIYQADDGTTRLDVHIEQETVWLTQDQMADLFGRERSVITKHLRNVFREGELDEASVRANFARTAADGKTNAPTLLLIIRHLLIAPGVPVANYRPFNIKMKQAAAASRPQLTIYSSP
jgi:hypothetical protein